MDANAGSCSLHLHLRYTQLVSPYFNSSRPKGPLSIESAPMIIIAHGKLALRDKCDVMYLVLLGTVGSVRDDTGQNTKVYLSNDGGYTWIVSILLPQL